MNRDEQIKKTADEIAKRLTDDGKIMAAGYVLFEQYFGIANTSAEQRNDMRVAFFAGAQHLWGTIMGILNPGAEPTARDMERMDKINTELEAFVEQLKRELRKRRPNVQ